MTLRELHATDGAVSAGNVALPSAIFGIKLGHPMNDGQLFGVGG